MTSTREKALKCVPCIHYPVQFTDTNETQVQALIDLGSEVNAMTLTYASRLGLWVHRTDMRTQKIDGSILETFGMILTSFQVEDKLGRTRFFQETFLLADIRTEVVLGMPFLTPSNADVQFIEKELTERSYITAEALSTTKWVELINKKEFAKATLDEKSETVFVYMVSLNLALGIYPNRMG